MTRRLFSRRRSRGQSLVELALVLPMIVILLAAVFDIGRVLDASIVLANSVRVGARFGASHPSWFDSVRSRVVEFSNNSGWNFTGVLLQGSDVDVASGGAAGSTIRVTASFNLPLFFGPAIGIHTIRIVRSAEMMILVDP